jgi:hypothetical protein
MAGNNGTDYFARFVFWRQSNSYVEMLRFNT